MSVVLVRRYKREWAFVESTEPEGAVVLHLLVQLVMRQERLQVVVLDRGDNGVAPLVDTIVHVAVELNKDVRLLASDIRKS